MKILIAALLSVALIQAVPNTSAKQLNNSEAKAAAARQAQTVTSSQKAEPKAEVAPEAPAPTPQPEPQPVPEVETPVEPTPVASGSCADEIAKYNWSHNVALAVARAESGLDTSAVNNNPATGDYSVGCFQVNIYGRNALSRPSEPQLKDAATNVAWAHKIYTGNGNSFIGQWGVCRSKVSCY